MQVRLNMAVSRSFCRMGWSLAGEAKIKDPIGTVDTDLTSGKRFSAAYSRVFNTPFKGRSEKSLPVWCATLVTLITTYGLLW
jgi:hypothetical protein